MEEEWDIPSRDQNEVAYQQFLIAHGGPAYLRRANEVEGALETLKMLCERQREEWLTMPRTRLGLLKALAGEWESLAPIVAHQEQLTQLEQLHDELAPKLRARIAPTSSARKMLRAFRECQQSVTQFNKRWRGFVENLDLSFVNELREGYNRFYVLEKECAVRSARVARQGFEQLPPLMPEDLLRLYPLFPVEQLFAEAGIS